MSSSPSKSQQQRQTEANLSCQDNKNEWETVSVDYIHVDLQGAVQHNELLNRLKSGSQHKWIGLDSDEPVIQIGNQVFTGKYRASLGTTVFFEQIQEDPSQDLDLVFAKEPPEISTKFVCKSTKKLACNRVFLEPKQQQQETEK